MRLCLFACLLVSPVALATPQDLLARLDRVQIDQMGQDRWQAQCRQGNPQARCAQRLEKALSLPMSDTRMIRLLSQPQSGPASR